MNGLLGAVQFLTRVPLRLRSPVAYDRVLPWFGVVGALIGLAVGGAAVGLGEVLPVGVAAACAIATGLLITGAFHEDGLADVADAFGGGWTRERRFEILKDSRHGTYGVAALAMSVLVRFASAASIAAPAALFAGFVAAHVLGRVSAVAALLVAPAAGAGLGADYARRARLAPCLIGIVVGIGIVVVATGWWSLPLLGAAAVGTFAVVTLAMRKIGGLVGDVLGAIEQVVECLVLIVVSGLAARHGIWWHR